MLVIMHYLNQNDNSQFAEPQISPHRFRCGLSLSRRIQHIFNKNPIPHGGVIDENMGHGPHNLPILQNGAARHE